MSVHGKSGPLSELDVQRPETEEKKNEDEADLEMLQF